MAVQPSNRAAFSSKNSSLKATVKDQSGAGRLKIGDILRKEGYITNQQYEEALKILKRSGGRLSSILLQLGHIEDTTIVNVLSRLHGFNAVTIAKEKPTKEALQVMPFAIAKRYMAFPLQINSKTKTLQVTMVEPTDTSAVGSLQAEVKMGLTVCVSTERDIIEAYKSHFEISDEEYKNLLSEEEEAEEDLSITQIDDFGQAVGF